jgi:hypothetical protein
MKSRGRTEKNILRRLSAGLTQEELYHVLSQALSTLGHKGVERLAGKLGPDTGETLRRALRSSGKKPVPGKAKLLQEWDRAWSDWDDRISEASDEDGEYVVREHHWEHPYFDTLAVTQDLEPIAARMSRLQERVFDEGLDPKLDFSSEVAQSVESIASSLPDFIEPFEAESFALGPKATGCLIAWERRKARSEGKTAFNLLDKLRALEADNPGLQLDSKALIFFMRSLGKDDKKAVFEAVHAHRDDARWKSVLDSAHSCWFRIYKDLCRGLDPSAYLKTCRDAIARDWTQAFPVLKQFEREKAHEEVCGVCAQAASAHLYLRDVTPWDPRESMLAPHGCGPLEGRPDERFLQLLAAWRKAAAALGRQDTAEALRLQATLLCGWKNWDKALAAFRALSSPDMDAMREKFFDEWRSLVVERSLHRVEFERDRYMISPPPPAGWSWVHAIADAARMRAEDAAGFHEDVSAWLRQLEQNPGTLKHSLDALARFSLDIDGGVWLKEFSPSLALVLGRGWPLERALIASRRAWLARLKAEALAPELQAFWKRNLCSLVREQPFDASSDYSRCVDWLAALWEIDPDAGRGLLHEWAAAHWRRRNLWRAVGRKGLPVPELRPGPARRP